MQKGPVLAQRPPAAGSCDVAQTDQIPYSLSSIPGDVNMDPKQRSASKNDLPKKDGTRSSFETLPETLATTGT